MKLEWLEQFALGEREKALAEWVPGTQEFFYYRCLPLVQTAVKTRANMAAHSVNLSIHCGCNPNSIGATIPSQHS